jgi:hypothetical protein
MSMRASSMTPSEGLASFLRVGEESEVRLASNRLTDTRIEFLSGDVLVECAEIQKGSKVTLLYKDQAIEMRKNGLYRLTGQPVLLRVYRGEATIAEGAKVTALREGRQMTLNGLDIVEKFDNKLGDPLYRWSKRRSEYIALANVSAAKSLRDSGYSLTSSAWRWNPWFGMYTFIPARGMYWSPFGYGYYAPNTIYRVYERPNPSIVAGNGGGYGGGGGGASYNSNLGYSTVSRSNNASYSNTSVSSSAPAAASSASSGARGGDTGGARDTGSSGGRGK